MSFLPPRETPRRTVAARVFVQYRRISNASVCALPRGSQAGLRAWGQDRRSTSRLRIVARLSTSARDSARSIRTIGPPCVSSAWTLVEEPWRPGGIPGHCGRRGQRGQAGRRGQRHRHQRIACESSGNPRASRYIRGWEVTTDEERRHACRKSRHQTEL